MHRNSAGIDFHESLREHRSAKFIVRTIGSTSDPPVVMLPSLGRGSHDFDPLARTLAEHGYSVVLPEPRGIGGSTGNFDDQTTLHDLARDLGEFIIPQFAERPPVLIGHAFGNRLARTVASDFPDVVGRLVLIAAGGLFPIGANILAAMRGSMDPSLPREERLQHLATAFFAPGNDPSVWLAGWWPDIAAKQVTAVRNTPVEDWWEAGGKVITVLQAEHDAIAPRENAEDLQRRLGAKRVRIVDISGAGHAMLPEQPDQIAKALLTTLAE